jgi:hypothetical protein
VGITFAVTAVSVLPGSQMMENEEVLAKIDEYRLLISLGEDTYLRLMGISVLDACEAAVKKQIPQKPIAFDADGIPTHKCPCGELVSSADYFCPFCGQALDWED